MTYPVIHSCPVCQHELHVKKLQCSQCDTTIENEFTLSKFAAFSEEQLKFIEVFLLNRGNIKGVEKALHISYPTVRNRLNEIISLLRQTEDDAEREETEIIDQVESGELSVQEAIDLLKGNRGG